MKLGMESSAVQKYQEAYREMIGNHNYGSNDFSESFVNERMADYFLKFCQDYKKALEYYMKAKRTMKLPSDSHFVPIVEKTKQAIVEGCVALHGTFLLKDE